MTSGLRRRGYIVLEAGNDGEALEWIKIHSRHIHVLLISGDRSGRLLAATIKPYRPDMAVIFVAANEADNASDAVAPSLALDRVQEFVEAQRANRAAGGR